MSSWSFDLSAIPRDRNKPIWVETHKGEVIRTYYVAPTKTSPKGYWPGVGDESCIKCWQLFVKPEPSGISMRSDAGLDIVHRHSEINTPMLEDVGSGP
jgi:hypothetical protein